MFTGPKETIIFFAICVIVLLAMFCTFIVIIKYRCQQKQNIYLEELEALKVTHESALLMAQLEMQEKTFQNISREIHDNIGQKLVLAKLYLNTLVYVDINKTIQQVNSSVVKISEAINDLSDISRSMSSEIIISNGLLKGIEFEVAQLQKSGIYKIRLGITGNPIFLDSQKELMLFRIIQESLHNIIKHAAASAIYIHLDFAHKMLTMMIKDDGKGFEKTERKEGIGLINISKRISFLQGNFLIKSTTKGTKLMIGIPIN